MSTGSEMMIEIQQEKYNHQLAEMLGITYDELLELDVEINTEESSDGLVYNYILEISENAPKKITKKIEGLENEKYIWFAQWELDSLNNDNYNE